MGCCNIGQILYFIVQLAVLVFIVIGTPIDQFRFTRLTQWTGDACLTFWGMQYNCRSTQYDVRTPELWQYCSARKTRFQAAEAFSIISIAICAAAVLFGLIRLCCCSCFRWLCMVLNILAIGTICICWACMAAEYHNSRIGSSGNGTVDVMCGRLNSFTKYGAGFALFIVGWCLNFVAIGVLMLPC